MTQFCGLRGMCKLSNMLLGHCAQWKLVWELVMPMSALAILFQLTYPPCCTSPLHSVVTVMLVCHPFHCSLCSNTKTTTESNRCPSDTCPFLQRSPWVFTKTPRILGCNQVRGEESQLESRLSRPYPQVPGTSKRLKGLDGKGGLSQATYVQGM